MLLTKVGRSVQENLNLVRVETSLRSVCGYELSQDSAAQTSHLVYKK